MDRSSPPLAKAGGEATSPDVEAAMTDISRRSFFRFGAGAVLAAAVSSSVALPRLPELWGDGKHDDTDALQALFDLAPFIVAGRGIRAYNGSLTGGIYSISRPLVFRQDNIEFASADICALPSFAGGPIFDFQGSKVATLRDLRIDCRGLADGMRFEPISTYTAITKARS